MPVTDNQVATLRAFLVGDMDEHHRLRGQLADEPDKVGYTALIAAAFWEAVERRFPSGTPKSEVIRFVGDVRSRAPEADELLDQDAAERMILAVFTDESIAGLDTRTVVSHEVTLLSALVADEQLDDDKLDGFLAAARKVADQLLN